MTAPAQLDHLVLAGPSLTEAVKHVERLTGVRAADGGQHPIGTANALIALTSGGRRLPWYLEVIGPDPERTTTGPVTKFGIHRRRRPEMATWAIHPDDVDAAAESARAVGVPYAERSPLSRRTPAGELLEWQLIVQGAEAAGADELVPFLIDWGATAHPGLGDLPALELLELRAESREPDELRAKLTALGLDLEVRSAETPALVATVAGQGGAVELR